MVNLNADAHYHTRFNLHPTHLLINHSDGTVIQTALNFHGLGFFLKTLIFVWWNINESIKTVS